MHVYGSIYYPDCLSQGPDSSRTVAITPFRQIQFDFAEIKRVCQACTAEGFNAIYEAGPARPFRFLYVSGSGTPRDPTRRPMVWGDYQVMRVS